MTKKNALQVQYEKGRKSWHLSIKQESIYSADYWDVVLNDSALCYYLVTRKVKINDQVITANVLLENYLTERRKYEARDISAQQREINDLIFRLYEDDWFKYQVKPNDFAPDSIVRDNELIVELWIQPSDDSF